MNSLIYRSCHNGVIESGDYWNQQGLEHQSCTRSSTELFDSTADLNTSRSTKDETFSRLDFLVAAKKGRPFNKKKNNPKKCLTEMLRVPCSTGRVSFTAAPDSFLRALSMLTTLSSRPLAPHRATSIRASSPESLARLLCTPD